MKIQLRLGDESSMRIKINPRLKLIWLNRVLADLVAYGMGKRKMTGQKCQLHPRSICPFIIAHVSPDGKATRGGLHADLVTAPGLKSNPHKTQTIDEAQALPRKPSPFGSRLIRLDYPNHIAGMILDQPV